MFTPYVYRYVVPLCLFLQVCLFIMFYGFSLLVPKNASISFYDISNKTN